MISAISSAAFFCFACRLMVLLCLSLAASEEIAQVLSVVLGSKCKCAFSNYDWAVPDDKGRCGVYSRTGHTLAEWWPKPGTF
jgi:hypothetical protein